jgi:hypothetical protein
MKMKILKKYEDMEFSEQKELKSVSEIEKLIEDLEIKKLDLEKEYSRLGQIDILSDGMKFQRDINNIEGQIKALNWVLNK